MGKKDYVSQTEEASISSSFSEEICKRNMIRYGNESGPNIEWYRSKGFEWEEIIEKSLNYSTGEIKFNERINKIDEL